MTEQATENAPLTEAWVDLLDHALAEDGCHGFYDDHVNTNRAVMQIVAEAKAEAVRVMHDEIQKTATTPNETWRFGQAVNQVERRLRGAEAKS